MMLSLKRKRLGISLSEASPGADLRVYAIGDVHGCLSELTAMLGHIKSDLNASPVEAHQIIFLGDYCDRGPDVQGVLNTLRHLVERNTNVTCLLGNHDEKLMLARESLERKPFIQFLRYGGVETLCSFGVDHDELRALEQDCSKGARRRLADLVNEHVPKTHFQFLRSLPRSTEQGDFFFCHAGIDPKRSLKRQRPDDLIWIREPFLSHESPFEKVVVHGHTRQIRPDVRTNRINVDTSCCYGNLLTCVVLEATTHRFMQVPAMARHWIND